MGQRIQFIALATALLGAGSAPGCGPASSPAPGGGSGEATTGGVKQQLVVETGPDGKPRQQVRFLGPARVVLVLSTDQAEEREVPCSLVAVAEFTPDPGLESLFQCGETRDQVEPLVLAGDAGLLWAGDLQYAVVGVRALELVGDRQTELLLGAAGMNGYYVALKWRGQAFEEIFVTDLGGLDDLALVPSARAEEMFGDLALEGRARRDGVSITMFRWEWDAAKFHYVETYRRQTIEGLDPDELTRLGDPAAREAVKRLLTAIPEDDRPTFLGFLPPDGLLLDGKRQTVPELEQRLVEDKGLLALLQVVAEESPEWKVRSGPHGELRLLETTTGRHLLLARQPDGRYWLIEVGKAN